MHDDIPDVPMLGIVAKLRSRDVDFDAVLEAGPDRAMEYFDEMLCGIDRAQTDELDRLEFFHAVYRETRVAAWPGMWATIEPAKAVALARSVETILPSASESLRRLLTDMRALFVRAAAEGCPVAFMLGSEPASDEVIRSVTEKLEDRRETPRMRWWIALLAAGLIMMLARLVSSAL